MQNEQLNNPLHGVTLEKMLTELLEKKGWEDLAKKTNFNCFKKDPSVKSALKFLRKTPWAREKIECLYLSTLKKPSPWGLSKKS